MEVAEESGVIAGLTKLISPLMRFLFPKIPKGHRAWDSLSANFVANIYLLPIILQYTTATTVLKNVATIAGAITAAGLALPYWLRYAIIFTGMSCSDEIFITRKVHISLLAVRVPKSIKPLEVAVAVFVSIYSPFPRSRSNSSKSLIARLATVASQPIKISKSRTRS